MKIGTKSLLFGVHQFLFHPLTVGIAWRRLFGRWPTVPQWICIIVHDWGYWGCADLDGREGRKHPLKGAEIAGKLVSKFHSPTPTINCRQAGTDAIFFTAGHSVNFSRAVGIPISRLYYADKYSVLVEPGWFYLLRARLSGEIHEYIDNSPFKGIPDITPADWLDWYRTVVKNKINESRLRCRTFQGR